MVRIHDPQLGEAPQILMVRGAFLLPQPGYLLHIGNLPDLFGIVATNDWWGDSCWIFTPPPLTSTSIEPAHATWNDCPFLPVRSGTRDDLPGANIGRAR